MTDPPVMPNDGSVSRSAVIRDEGAYLERSHLPLWKVGALGLAYMLIGPSMAMSAGALISFSAQAAWLSNLRATMLDLPGQFGREEQSVFVIVLVRWCGVTRPP
jgi:hypothetical protein